LTSAIPVLVFSVTRLSIVLAAAGAMGLSVPQTSALIVALYAIPGILTIFLTATYRIPLLVGWSTPGIVFLAGIGQQVPYAELLGAMMVAGVLVAVAGATGLTPALARLVPAPIVFGLLGGMVLPFIVRIFTDLGTQFAVVGAVLAAFLVGRRFLEPRIPALIPALIAGLIVAAAVGQVNRVGVSWVVPEIGVLRPEFSLAALVTVVPIAIIVISVQGNLPATVYLESQAYRPPSRLIEVVSGSGTGLAALIGTAPMSLASLVMPLLAGPSAGDRSTRHLAAYVSGAGLVSVALFASIAAELPSIVPMALLLALAGLALLPVLGQALRSITGGPLRLGPLFAFAVAFSDISLFGLGPVFWALTIGVGVSMAVEPSEFYSSRSN
jgi:benzoate membrane transport protein